jgi:hypothetical protein
MKKSAHMPLAVGLFLLAAAIAVAPGTAAGQSPDEPSMGQTIDYILARIDDVALTGGTSSVRSRSKTIRLVVKHFQSATIEDCRLTIKETKLENNVLVFEKTASVPLAQMNPASVGSDARQIFLTTTNDGDFVDQKITQRQDTKAQPVERQMIDTLPIHYSKGQGEKLARAFSHLITLCGGQKDLF